MGGQARKVRIRTLLFRKQRGACYYCGEPMLLAKVPEGVRQPPRLATIDHIIPKSKGGAFAENCVGACAECNSERGDRDARLFMLEKQGVLA